MKASRDTLDFVVRSVPPDWSVGRTRDVADLVQKMISGVTEARPSPALVLQDDDPPTPSSALPVDPDVPHSAHFGSCPDGSGPPVPGEWTGVWTKEWEEQLREWMRGSLPKTMLGWLEWLRPRGSDCNEMALVVAASGVLLAAEERALIHCFDGTYAPTVSLGAS